MEGISLSAEQLRLLPTDIAADTKAFRMSSVRSIKQLKPFRQAKQRIILASDNTLDAIFVTKCSLLGHKDRGCSPYFSTTHGMGDVIAANNRAAVEVLLDLTKIRSITREHSIRIWRGKSIQVTDGGLKDADLATILTNCYPSIVTFRNFYFAPETVFAWTRLEYPIGVSISSLLSCPMHATALMGKLILEDRQSSFGRFNLSEWSDLISSEIASRLALCQTLVFDELVVNFTTIPLESLAKLFACRRSIRRLKLVEYPIRDSAKGDFSSFLPIVECHIAGGACPPCLDLRIRHVFDETIERALRSPLCALEEISGFAFQGSRHDQFARALDLNQSLKRIRFVTQVELIRASECFWRAAIAKDETSTNTAVLNRSFADLREWRIETLLRQNKRWTIAFPDDDKHFELVSRVEKASFDRFRGGVTNALPMANGQRTWYTALALQHCFRDSARTAMLLHCNLGPLVELTSDVDAASFRGSRGVNQPRGPNKRQRLAHPDL